MMSRMVRWSGLTVTLAIVAGLVGVLASRRTEPVENLDRAGRGGFSASSERKSIGDVINESDLVVRAAVLAVGPPRWNSPDGHDWTEEYLQNQSAYLVPPMPVIPVDLSVTEVLLQGQNGPTVESGGQLEATFLSSSLVPGEERVFFLRWTDLYMSTGSVEIWYGDEEQGTWFVQRRQVTPASQWQAFSVASAVMSSRVEGHVDSQSLRGSLELPRLKGIIVAEAAREGVDVAGFAQWPFDRAYEEYAARLDADDPAAHADPSEV
ncbi:MAG: hypothetical protein ACRD1T_05875 [Acidimicrobiia bacterium]